MWHVLTSIAITLLIKAGNDLEEPFCLDQSAVTPLSEAGAVRELRRGLAAGDWTWLPVYPLGHAQIEGHLPFSLDNVLLVIALFVLLEVVKVAVFAVLDVCLTGKKDEKLKLNTCRFKTVVYFTSFHLLSTIYNLWHAPEPSLAFLQPALPGHLRVYYLVQIAYTVQSFKNLEKMADVMSAHHLITFLVLLSSWRFGFVRIGQQVLWLHDSTDVFIDVIRIGSAVGSDAVTYLGAAGGALMWPWLRIYAFSSNVLVPILRNTEMYEVYGRVGVPSNDIRKGFHLYLVCLVGILVLNVYWWIMLVVRIVKEVQGGKVGEEKPKAKQKKGTARRARSRSRSRSKAKKF